MAKANDAFRTIGEISDDLDVPKHVLRFWEGKFPQLKPMKRGGGRRFYRPEDVTLLLGIKQLLHASGYTIKGVQRILREDGVDAVKTLAAGGAVSPTSTIAGAGASPRRIKKRDQPAVLPSAYRAHLVELLHDVEACVALAKGTAAARKSPVKSKRA